MVFFFFVNFFLFLKDLVSRTWCYVLENAVQDSNRACRNGKHINDR